MEKLNVAIADDNERMVQLLDEIVASDKDLQVVGTAKNGVEAYEIIKHKQPDVVLLDIVMPKLDGLALLEKVKKDNKEEAKLITSETILDLQFIEDPDTNVISLRLGNIIRNINKEER